MKNVQRVFRPVRFRDFDELDEKLNEKFLKKMKKQNEKNDRRAKDSVLAESSDGRVFGWEARL